MRASATVRSAFVASLAALLAITATPALSAAGPVPAADAWQTSAARRTPVDGATFNDPSSGRPQQNRIIDYVGDMIDQTPRGQTIRITQYNLTCPSTITKLIAAFKRGVNVQIVVNDKVLGEDTTTRGVNRRFQRLLGTNTSKPSFFVVCKRGCRTGPGAALHSKFISITRVITDAGPRDNVLLTASGNITCGWATARQYNDQFAMVGRADLSTYFNSIFAQLAADKRIRKPFRTVTSGPYTAWFFPRPGSTRTNDPIWQALRSVQCSGAQNTGPGARTEVRVKMFTWNGDRGMNLARKLYQLDQAGCDVEVILGAPGAGAVRELRRPGRNGGIEVYDSRRDRNLDGEIDLYTHMKMMSIKGRVGSNPKALMVYTGSANWTPQAFKVGDELLLRMTTRRAYRQYDQHFEYVKTRSVRRSNTSTTIAKIRPYNLNPVAE